MFRYAPQGLLQDRLRRPGPDDLLVLDGATVIDGTGAAPIPNATIVLHGDRIERIVPGGTSLDLPTEPAPERLDLGGAFVMPGMIDCHVHLYGAGGHDPMSRYIAPYPSVRILRAAKDANVLLSAGFTTVRHLGHGEPEHAEAVKDSINAGLIAGPRMLTCGWAISQTGGHGKLQGWPYHMVEEMRPRSAFCDGPDALRKFVRQLLGDGADVIKIYTTEGVISTADRGMNIPNFTLPEIEAITDEAHRRGVRVAAHATGLEGSKNAIKGGVDTLEHGPNETDDDLLKLMVDNKSSFVPTLSVFSWAAAHGASAGLASWAVDRAARWMVGRRPLAATAIEAGITVAVGTDSSGYPRFGNNAEELVQMVESGIKPMAALVAATRNGARALGLADSIGTLEEGKLADILVLERNPLEGISSLQDQKNLRLVIQSRPSTKSA